MSLEIEKPLPLMVGNKAYYSLTSYDPCEVTVDVPYTSDEDIELGMLMTARDMGGTAADLDNPAWIAGHFEGIANREQLREAVREQMTLMNAQFAEQQKLGKCVEVLASRLRQQVPPQHLEDAQDTLRVRFAQQMQDEGMTPKQFMERTGTTVAQLEAMFVRQAKEMAEGDAALSAYAHEKKLKVDEHEYGRLLGIAPTEVQKVIEQARAAGQADELREAALRAKAAQAVVAECSCSYRHETPEEAKARAQQYRKMQAMLDGDGGAEASEGTSEAHTTGFKLV